MELFGIFAILATTATALAWYYIVPLVVLILVVSAFSNDDKIGAEALFFMAIFGAIGYALYGQISISEAVLGVIYYLLIGSVWSILNYIITIRKEMIKVKNDGGTSKDYDVKYFRDKISSGRIAGWVAWFPFSMLEYIIGQFFVNVFQTIVKNLGGVYNKITVHYYDKFFN